MDVILIGGQTGGKYCAGYLLGAPDWYDAVRESLGEEEYAKAVPYVDDWGIYVMYARYADCHGVTLSMPDGIAPDVEAEDRPRDGYALGDPQETMLSVALALMEDRPVPAGTRAAPTSALAPVPDTPRRPGAGLLIAK